jgi:4-hydroxybenzoyl-CoA reductase subunit beta
MPEFEYHHPRSAEEAVALFHRLEDAMYVAGGTDLLPNLKHKLFSPKHVIGLTGLPKATIGETSTHFELDGGLTLHAIATDSRLMKALPPLTEAAGLVAGPQIRRMGTIGGNVLLDTRCLYYNQTEFWREALGYCLKKDGSWCHVVGGPKTCVAAQSSDTVPVLLALDASIVLLSEEGERELALRDLYQFDGIDHLKIQKGELLTRVRIPKPPTGFRGTYKKLRTRDSIDFPQLGVAVCGVWIGDVLEKLDIVVGAVNPKPKPIKGLEVFFGRVLEDDSIGAIAALVQKQTRPQEAVHGDVSWRRAMASIFVSRALRDLAHEKEQANTN